MKNKVIKEARSWIGTPFRHQARCKGAGVDCLGLVVESYRKAGADVRDKTDYSRYPTGDSLIEGLSEQLTEIPLEEIDTGDILVMAQKRQANHVMLYVKESDTVIHSYYRQGGVLEQAKSIYDRFIMKAFRYE